MDYRVAWQFMQDGYRARRPSWGERYAAKLSQGIVARRRLTPDEDGQWWEVIPMEDLKADDWELF